MLWSLLIKVLIILVSGGSILRSCNSALTANPDEVVDGVLTLCPGTSFSLTCSYSSTANSSTTRWEFSFSAECTTALVSHDQAPMANSCGPFTIDMISISSAPTRNSTAQATANTSMDGLVAVCRNGDRSSHPEVGNITLRVIDPTAQVDSMEYFVESAVTGGVRLNVSSPRAYGTGVMYSGGVNGRSVRGVESVVTVIGLDYTQSHSVSVTATSLQCSDQTTTTVAVNFIIQTPNISQLVSSIMCSNQSLPTQLTWITAQGVQSTTNTSTPLTPPMISLPVVSFTSSSGGMGSASSSSPYTLPNPTVNDVYSFNVSVSNVAGVYTETLSSVRVSPLNVDVSRVSKEGCLGLAIGTECAENVSSGDFSVKLVFGVGPCQTVNDISNLRNVTPIITSPSGVCVPVGTFSVAELCYNATLLYQGTAITSLTNQELKNCSVSALEAQVGENVEFGLSRSANDGIVPHSTMATFDCSRIGLEYSGQREAVCLDGKWMVDETSCTITEVSQIAIAQGVLLVVVLVGVIVLTVVMMCLCLCWRKARDKSHRIKGDENKGLMEQLSSGDHKAVYADPNNIEHQIPVTGEEYAMADVKGKKKKPTQEAALYQDPNTIEPQTAPSGDAYAVVDKPKRGSSKKGEPDKVPPGSEGLTYADLDVAAHKPKPAPQLPTQDPGHVEYADVKEKAGL